MEYKADDIISYNEDGETIYLQVTPTRDITCQGCYFHRYKYPCSTLRNVIGNCTNDARTDKQTVIFTKVKDNNMKKKTTIDIYVVMQTHKTHRSFCGVFTSFEEANARFEALLEYFKKFYKVQPKGWTIECLPSQIKVSIIGDITLYLCKETKEINIEVDSNKQSSGIYKKDLLGKWINIDDINPIEIKGFKPGDYVILRIEYESKKFDYKLSYVDCIRNRKVMFNIQNINVLRTPIKITDFCILPDYISDNFYKINK